MWVRFPRVERGSVMSFLIVFPLGNKRNQSKGEGRWASVAGLGGTGGHVTRLKSKEAHRGRRRGPKVPARCCPAPGTLYPQSHSHGPPCSKDCLAPPCAWVDNKLPDSEPGCRETRKEDGGTCLMTGHGCLNYSELSGNGETVRDWAEIGP